MTPAVTAAQRAASHDVTFKDDISLSDEQIATIATWVDHGAPLGDPADMPQRPQFPNWSAWQIGEPDLVVRYPHYLAPAEGPDVFGALYAQFGLETDRYSKAIQTRPVDGRSRQADDHPAQPSAPMVHRAPSVNTPGLPVSLKAHARSRRG